jgi:hypothetical protein
MLENLRARLTYANVMATVAVFIALGGSSYAAIQVTGENVPKDALTGADIKNLSGKDVRNSSLTGKDIKNGTLQAKDFASGEVPGSTGESMLTGSTQSGAISPLAGGGAQTLDLPPSGVATFGGSSIQLTPNATIAADALTVEVEHAPPPNAALRFTFTTNRIPSPLSCTVPAGRTTCQNITSVLKIFQGSDISVVVDNPGSADSVATGARWAWRATTL